PRRRARRAQRRRRPGRPAHVDGRPRRPRPAARRRRGPGRDVPRHLLRGDLLARLHPGDRPDARTRPRDGAGDHHRRVPAPRPAAERDELSVVADQVGQPTWTADLADLVLRLVDAGAPAGTYHGTSSGETSWHGFTREIVRTLGRDPEMVRETTTDAFPRPAP